MCLLNNVKIEGEVDGGLLYLRLVSTCMLACHSDEVPRDLCERKMDVLDCDVPFVCSWTMCCWWAQTRN